MKVAVTGKEGFIGYHLYNTILYSQVDLKIVDFPKKLFYDESKLDKLIKSVDVIVHLAGLNRSDDDDLLLNTNIDLSEKIASSAQRTNFKGKIIFASSTLEKSKTKYGKSKKISNNIFLKSSEIHNYSFTSIVIPNVFGPFCKPHYNSFISTFCHNLIFGEKLNIEVDKEVKLIFINNLIKEILNIIKNKSQNRVEITEDVSIKVSGVKKILEDFNKCYIKKNTIPYLNSDFEKNLFLTFQSFIKIEDFPKTNKLNIDNRGNFSEIIRSYSEGQSSFSITKSGITRGNHFHTRKIERFAVIKGQALIEVRKIGAKDKVSFKIDGESPSFVDMKVWHTHNIKNIGNSDLITFFWINEFYNEDDPDTFFEKV